MPQPLDAGLRDWLNHTVYPRLSHRQIFGVLPNYHEGTNGDFYADCPRCHKRGTFYGYSTWHVGQCKSCHRTIGWFAFLRWPDRSTDNERAIRVIAELAGVTTGPQGEGLIAHPEVGVKSHSG